jgi:hypothetical protein
VRSYRETVVDRRDASINEVVRVEDLCASFDLSAFPLPVRVGMRDHGIFCMCDVGLRSAVTAHVFMRIRPRGTGELLSLEQDADGTVELRSCSGVTQEVMTRNGNVRAVEVIRNMVMHEVYESTLFRGDRIFDPHDYRTRPKDQPF